MQPDIRLYKPDYLLLSDGAVTNFSVCQMKTIFILQYCVLVQNLLMFFEPWFLSL